MALITTELGSEIALLNRATVCAVSQFTPGRVSSHSGGSERTKWDNLRETQVVGPIRKFQVFHTLAGQTRL